jgi:pimeloyl-ACP methyl ester carboxylesterase
LSDRLAAWVGVEWTTRDLTATDGVRLQVYEAGDRRSPSVLLVHGFPDDHSVWDGLARLLVGNHHVVSFDVRGAGASQVPATRAGYELDQLADDLLGVAASVRDDGAAVHLVAHDWGSSQSWRAVTEDRAVGLIASYTSISGPDLSMAGAWLQRTWKSDRRAALSQIGKSWYLQVFRLPWVPDMFWRSGLGFRSVGRPRTDQGVRNAVNGLNIYRVNLARSAGRRPRRCAIPVQVLAPRRDRYVGARMQCEAPARWTADLATHSVDGGHWVVSQHPERIAALVADFVAAHV